MRREVAGPGHPAGPLGASAIPPLLASKLAAPPPPFRPVVRKRLLDALTVGASGRLTLVSAPAGAGKTVLLSSWLAQGMAPGPVAWVTVDRGDNDPPRFWAHLLASLRGTGRVPPDGILAFLEPPPREGDGTFLPMLVNGLGELSGPVVVVLDDLYEIDDQRVIAGLDFVVQHAPAQVHVVAATRADPRLPLHRLRVRGELSEIRATDLAFTPAEAVELLDRSGITLDDHSRELLCARTEGWAAGICLAARALRRHPEPDRFVTEFAGDHRDVAEYLASEILSRQPPRVRDLLVRTSILEQVSGDLADALTGGSDGAQVLQELERSGGLVSAVDERGAWYRYHVLLAGALRAQLQRERPGEVVELHHRAAGWFQRHGYHLEAINHAIAAGDFDRAAAILVEHWFRLFTSGRADELRDLIAKVPEPIVRGNPELALVIAGNRQDLGDLDGADAYLRTAEAGALDLPEQRRRRLAVTMRLVGLYRARVRCDLDEVLRIAREIEGLPAGERWELLAASEATRSLLLTHRGGAELWTGNVEGALPDLREGLAAAERSGSDFLVLDARSQLALLEAVRGRLREADDLGRGAVELAGRSGWSRMPQTVWACVALAIVGYHRDDWPGVRHWLDEAREIANRSLDPMVTMGVAFLQALWLVEEGNLVAARGTIYAVTQDAPWRPPAFVETYTTMIEARLRAAGGDTVAARALLEASGNGDARPRAEPAIMRARLQLLEGDAVGALRTVAPCLDGTLPSAHVVSTISAWLVDAVARELLGDRERALRSLRRALAVGEPDGYRQAFVDWGTLLQGLLQQVVDEGGAWAAYAGALLVTIDRRTPAGPPPSPLVEPLSRRERAVLRYLPTTLSTPEIADSLFVSVNTVKTHVRNIYRKLDASGRRDAVRRARQLRLL